MAESVIGHYVGNATLIIGDHRVPASVELYAYQAVVDVPRMGAPPLKMPGTIRWSGMVRAGAYDPFDANRANPCSIELPDGRAGSIVINGRSIRGVALPPFDHMPLKAPD
jgi:hypothetical protein